MGQDAHKNGKESQISEEERSRQRLERLGFDSSSENQRSEYKNN